MKERRVNRKKKFGLLPNAILVSFTSEETDLVNLIRQRIGHNNVETPETWLQSIETIVQDEVQEAISPLTRTQKQWSEVRPQVRRSQRILIITKKRPVAEVGPRNIW
ncbi:hypothetical protein CEXT_760761 [Caerostris extrusa]|uniref:Uncharacterized protein n=1 Tax=Caerostris extrusa TaxID=172846 RepID=A0AAV4U8I8_CAEEX|nr:hypothetical protein CEXT_760761 [Caerostris extrusa]